MSENSAQGQLLSQRTVSTDRIAELHQSSFPNSPFILPSPSVRPNINAPVVEQLQPTCPSFPIISGEHHLVDDKGGRLEFQPNSEARDKPCYPDLRLANRLESLLPGEVSLGSMVLPREDASHQPLRTESDFLWSEVICLSQNASLGADGQHHYNSLRQQIWRHSLPSPVPTGNSTSDIYNAASNHSDCGVYPGEREYNCRRSIPPIELTPTRMTSLSESFRSSPVPHPGIPAHEPFRISPEQPVGEICELASRPGGLGSERLRIGMEGPENTIHVPPANSHRPDSVQVDKGEDYNSDHCNPILAEQALVARP